MMHRELSTFCALTLLVAHLAAQQFESRALTPIGGTRWQAAADFDGDGDADVLGVTGLGIGLAVNDGYNRFPDLRPLSGRARIVLARPLDIERDGDLDVLGLQVDPITRQQAPFLLRNDGVGFLDVTATHLPAGLAFSNLATFTVLDLDGDGDTDVLVTDSAPLALHNDGSGTFVNATAAYNLQAVAAPMSPIDVDGDGRDDLVLTGRATVVLLRNTGAAFVDESALRLPASLPTADFSASAADIDGDGDADLLLHDPRGPSPRLLRNQNGIFTDVTAAALPQLSVVESTPVFLDVDQDGDQDLFFSQGTLLRNDGSGMFTVDYAPPGVGSAPLVAIDAEGDGDVDVASIGNGFDVLRNDGTGTFVLTSAPDFEIRNALWFDVDGDGDLDALSGRLLYRNDGTGRLSGSILPIGPSLNVAGHVGDFDGDGDLDVVADGVYHNDGTGSFALGASLPLNGAVWMQPTAQYPRDVVADFDGDGDLDLVGTNGWPGSNPLACLYRNDGTGTFVADTGVFPTLPRHLAHEAGDFDGDGDADVLVSTILPPAAPFVLVNNGGLFAIGPSLPVVATQARFATLRPGQPPDVFCNGAVFRLQNGAYVDVTSTTFPAGVPQEPTIGDVDDDGLPDVLTFDTGTGLGWFARNDGTGRFPTWERSGLHRPARILDVDGDGDGDAVTDSGVSWNRHRQVALLLPPHTGRTLRVEISSRPGRASPLDLALLGIGWQRRAQPLPTPFGALHLDPIEVVLTLPITPPLGTAALDIAVPNDPALRGVDVFFQALHSTPAGLDLSNLAIGRVE